MTAPESRLLERHLHTLAGQRLLLVNPPADELPTRLRAEGCDLRIFHQDLNAARQLEQRGLTVEYGPWLAPAEAPQRVLLWQMKARAWHALLLDMLQAELPEGTPLWLVGEKRSGIQSSLKPLKQRLGQAEVLDKARHCTLIASRLQAAPSRLEDHLQSQQTEVAGETLRWQSLPGVFAHGRLDAGSRFLLEHLPRPVEGQVLDYGAGVGLLSLYLQQRFQPQRLVLLEPDALALACARRNLPQAHALAGTRLADAPNGLDWIISNPPFHQRQAQSVDVALALIEQAPAHLRAGGRLLLVANRFLPYHSPLSAAFQQVDIVAENPQYRVYLAQ